MCKERARAIIFLVRMCVCVCVNILIFKINRPVELNKHKHGAAMMDGFPSVCVWVGGSDISGWFWVTL